MFFMTSPQTLQMVLDMDKKKKRKIQEKKEENVLG